MARGRQTKVVRVARKAKPVDPLHKYVEKAIISRLATNEGRRTIVPYSTILEEVPEATEHTIDAWIADHESSTSYIQVWKGHDKACKEMLVYARIDDGKTFVNPRYKKEV